jgi:hypothetical protein
VELARVACFGLILAQLATIACGGGSPTAPTRAAGYAGEWLGTTEAGERVTFVISPTQKVMDLTFSYRLGECSGAETVSGLALEIQTAPSVGGSQGAPGFSHIARGSGELTGYLIAAEFKSNNAASGSLSLVTSCGTAGLFWSASRR